MHLRSYYKREKAFDGFKDATHGTETFAAGQGRGNSAIAGRTRCARWGGGLLAGTTGSVALRRRAACTFGLAFWSWAFLIIFIDRSPIEKISRIGLHVEEQGQRVRLAILKGME